MSRLSGLESVNGMDRSAHRKKLPEYGEPDDDIPEMTDAHFRRARHAKDVMPGLIEAAKKLRGRPKLERPKVQVTLRLDADVLESFRSEGQGWQSRINDVLARSVKRRKSA
jgi:uncharacterized protein (DUF4415 family)